MNPALLTTGLIGLSLLIAGPSARTQSPQIAQPQRAAAAGIPSWDFSFKSVIERPTENILASSSGNSGGFGGSSAGNAGFLNPKVEPGKVRWHPDFATARAASAKSGKPVLLFQMMGKLDDQFC
jgi:hypothetical protein